MYAGPLVRDGGSTCRRRTTSSRKHEQNGSNNQEGHIRDQPENCDANQQSAQNAASLARHSNRRLPMCWRIRASGSPRCLAASVRMPQAAVPTTCGRGRSPSAIRSRRGGRLRSANARTGPTLEDVRRHGSHWPIPGRDASMPVNGMVNVHAPSRRGSRGWTNGGVRGASTTRS